MNEIDRRTRRDVEAAYAEHQANLEAVTPVIIAVLVGILTYFAMPFFGYPSNAGVAVGGGLFIGALAFVAGFVR